MSTIKTVCSMSRHYDEDHGCMVRLDIKDRTSRATFLRLNMTAEQFTELVTGRMVEEVEGEVDKLDVVGHRFERVPKQVDVPDNMRHVGREATEAWLRKTYTPEPGWTLDAQLGQRDSFRVIDGRAVVNFSVTRYVHPRDEDDGDLPF